MFIFHLSHNRQDLLNVKQPVLFAKGNLSKSIIVYVIVQLALCPITYISIGVVRRRISNSMQIIAQGKTKCIQYPPWRMMTRKHITTKMSFMLVGHTKFTPD